RANGSRITSTAGARRSPATPSRFTSTTCAASWGPGGSAPCVAPDTRWAGGRRARDRRRAARRLDPHPVAPPARRRDRRLLAGGDRPELRRRAPRARKALRRAARTGGSDRAGARRTRGRRGARARPRNPDRCRVGPLPPLRTGPPLPGLVDPGPPALPFLAPPAEPSRPAAPSNRGLRPPPRRAPL